MSRNIVLVTIDSLRADHCGFMGYEKDTTPNLDAMAEEGLVFENAVAPGPTTPGSLPAVLTGHYPSNQETGPRSVEDVKDRLISHLSRHETVADSLSKREYATAGFTPNPWTSRHFGFESGFDHFEDFMNDDLAGSIWERFLEGEGENSRPVLALQLAVNWMQREGVFKPWTAFYDEVVEWTRTVDEPYFLWVFLLDPHFPYLPGAGCRSQSRWRTYEANLRLYLESQTTRYSQRIHDQLTTAYDDAIRCTDEFFGRLSTDLHDDDPAILVHADHGEAFGEHGTYGHQTQLYEENVRVPLVVSNVQSGTVTEPVSLRCIPDLIPKVADGDDPATVTDPAVLTRTDDGSKFAVYTEGMYYMRDKTDTKVVLSRGNGKQIIRNETMDSVARKLVNDRKEPELEKRRIASATEDVVGELESCHEV